MTAGLTVALPPREAFRLFTPEGERLWAEGWDPHYPAPADDDSAPGTVFRTHGHAGETVWTVVARDPGRRVAYARVTCGVNAGTVSVALGDSGDGGSDVTVTYELTALTGEAGEHLNAFADGFEDYIRSWEEAIAAVTPRTAGA